MPGLVPGIHVLSLFERKDVDGRDKPGHDDVRECGRHAVHFPTTTLPTMLGWNLQ